MSSEMLVTVQDSTWRHVPNEWNNQQHRCENLKSLAQIFLTSFRVKKSVFIPHPLESLGDGTCGQTRPSPLRVQRKQEAIAAVGNQNYYVLIRGTQTVHKFRGTTFAYTYC